MTGLNLSAVLSSVPTILVQFSFSSEKAVPRYLRTEGRETVKEKEERTSQKGGIELIEKSEKIKISSIIFNLERFGFFLVDGYSKELFHTERKGTYYVARFIFSRKKVEDDYLRFARKAFEMLSGDAFWTVKSYLNPSSEDGRNSFISINMVGRTPIRQGDGSLVRIWKKDREGNHVGTEAVPITPTGKLIFTRSGSLRVVAA